ncbi:activator-dependent family glycosyltransferase [Actinomadura craniellae]|uniref:Activator-dependent family glycosyltransferase n=1 Tax=Actinomadura craniellae TaxID=2231787 RepID=A0A365H398_9ACTN|nr:activator-dependent family glycosyltransferase [Actinomadura craniellae]RAY12693.1 activator-dependent family glycosyltransferase [Actinomadura craniellae]
MRILITSLEGSHFQLLVPMAWALRTAGHEVRTACKPELVETVTRAGLAAEPIECPPWHELLGEFHHEAIAYYNTLDTTGVDEAEESWEDHLAYETIITPALNMPLNSDEMIDELVGLARAWRPDLVIWETLCIAGAVAAVAVGAAHARLVSGPEQAMQITTRRHFLRRALEQEPEHREDPTAEWLDWTLERLGSARRFDETMLTGQFTIDTRPPSQREDLGLETVPVRYLPYNGRSVVPRWLREPPARPRVCLTLGVSITDEYRLWDLGSLLAAMLRTLAELDVEVVAAIAAEQREHLPELGENVRVVDFVPMNDLLPTCALVIHHAGYQTKATGEFHGVPQVVLTGWEWVSEAMGHAYEEQGTLLAIPLREFSAELFREKVVRVLTEPSFTENARRLRQEILAMDPPNDAVPAIEKLTAAHREET